MHINRRRKNKH